VSGSKPMVSIGMPTYNGERFIRQSLDSLLANDYHNFELIISDNASTDATADICLEYLAKDKRIQYYRNDTNRGAIFNFNRVFDLCHGKYCMFAADHDLWHPSFISHCVSILESQPDVVLVYPRTMLIDSSGSPLGLMTDQIDTRGEKPIARFRHIIWELGWCNMVYGVIRREALAQTGRFRCWAWDNVLLAELSLVGSYAQIPDPLFYRRENRPREDREMKIKRVLFDLNPATAAETSIKSLPRELELAHLEIVARAPISLVDKVRLWYSVKLRFGTMPRQLRCLRRIGKILRRIAVIFLPARLRRRIRSVFPVLRRLST